MKSSSRIIKNLEMIERKKSCVIPVNEIYIPKEDDSDSKNDYGAIIERANKEAEAIRKQAVEQAKNDAKATLEALREKTYNEAYEQGFIKGEERGFSQGMSKGEKEAELIRNQAKQVLESAHKSAMDMIDKNESEIIHLAMHITEKILSAKLLESDEYLIGIAQDACKEFKNKKHIMISIHPSKKELFESNLDTFKQVCPYTTFSIIEDSQVSQEGCILESDAQVVDTQINGQLENIKEALLEMRSSNE